MNIYLQTQSKTIDAIQYNGQEHELVKDISYDLAGNVIVNAVINSFKAVETYKGWKEIELTDWIVRKNRKIFVISDEMFQLMYDVNE